MGILDGLFNQQGGMSASGLLGNLPPWMTLRDGNSPVLPPWMQTQLGIASQGGFALPPQQEQAALPPNAQPAMGAAPMQSGPQMEPRRSIFTPPDSNPDSPPLGSPFGPPIGAPMQAPGMNAMAQAPQGMPPPQQGQGGKPPGGNPLGPIGDFLIGTLMGGPRGGIGAVLGHNKKQETYDQLVANGVDPQKAWFVVNAPEAGQLAGLVNKAGGTSDIQEFEYAKKQGFDGTFIDWMQKKKSVSGEFGMTPIWGVGPDGKAAVLQLGKSGDAKQSALPPGFELARDPIKVEGPTGTAILDPQTRQQVGFIPKDVRGAAKEKELGDAQGQAEANLPTLIATAENSLKTIQQLENHPGKKNWGALGMGAMLPDMPGSSTRGFGALVDQVKGQNFLTAFQSLKGAGAITEMEGAKAEKAQARLDRAQNEHDFDAALKDLKEVITAGMMRARQKAKGNFTPGSSTAAAPPSPDPLGLR